MSAPGPVLAAARAAAMPLGKPVKIGKDAGEVVTALGASFTWKVKGADTGYAFAVYEMALAPGRGVPLHMHPFAEFFHVLEGRVDVMGVDAEDTLEWMPVAAGESANAPVNAPHGVMNRADRLARVPERRQFPA